MAVILRKLFTRPFLIAALICIFVFYSGLFSFKQKNPAVFIFPDNKINLISGKITSSPVKCASGTFYSCNFILTSCGCAEGAGTLGCSGGTGGTGGIACSAGGPPGAARGTARGQITLYIPSELTEALFPGHLYSSAYTSKDGTDQNRAESRKSHLFESGLKASFSGSYKEGSFLADSCIKSFWETSIQGHLSHLRALCRLAFKRMLYAWGHAGGLLLALLSGARDFTENSTANAFKSAGLSHILALSGMHMSLFSGIALFAGKRAGSIRLSYFLRFLVIILFLWFAGMSPSLFRAFLCASLAILASMSGVPGLSTFDLLTLAFLLQSAICPSHIHNPGFLLSYGALAGITLFSSLVYKVFVRFTPHQVSSSLSASLSAQSLTAPVSLKLFGSFCPIGIAATMIISPLVTFFIYAGLTLIILSMIFPILLTPSGIFMNFLYTIIKYLVMFFARFPYINIQH